MGASEMEEKRNLQFYALTGTGLELYSVEGVPEIENEYLEKSNSDSIDEPTGEFKIVKIREMQGVEFASWNDNGNLLAVVMKHEMEIVSLIEVESWKEIHRISFKSPVRQIMFSPKSSFLVILCKFLPTGPASFIYNVSGVPSEECSFMMKDVSIPIESVVQFTTDECSCLRKTVNGVWLHRSPSNSVEDLFAQNSTIKIDIPNINAISLSPVRQNCDVNFATFSVPRGNVPGSIALWSVSSDSQPTKIAHRNMFDVDDSEFSWCQNGLLVSAEAKSSIDKEGKTYYGSSCLFLGSLEDKTIEPLLDKSQGPISGIRWRPVNNPELLIGYGEMPSNFDLFDAKTRKPNHTLGKYRRNHARWSRTGRYLLVAGFGNLPGEIDVWDRAKKSLIGNTKRPWTVECEFCDDEYLILCATTSPRLRVDNCVQLIRYNGDLLCRHSFNDLLHAVWRPGQVTTPRIDSGSRKPLLTALQENKPVSSGVYRPRGALGSGIIAGEQRQQQLFVTKLDNGKRDNTTHPVRSIPGLDAVVSTKKPKKNKAAKQVATPPKTGGFEISEDF